MTGYNPREPAPADARGQYWAATINTHDDDPDGFDLQRSIDAIETLYEDKLISYAVGQWERGDNEGRLHLQAYIIFKKPKYCNWIASRIYRSMLFCSKAEWAKGGINYCKDPTKPSFVKEGFEFGTSPSAFQGKRTDLDDVNKMIAENKLTTYREVNDYRTSVAARHANWVNWRLSEASRDEYLSEDRYDDPYVPRVWQYWLARILEDTKPAERKVLFIVDKIGHAGKTRFTFEFSRTTNKRFQVMRAMPKRDMASALEYRREILWIDIPRGKLEFITSTYVFMEEAKDGVVGKEKYGSHTQYNKRLHLVTFMNDDVDIGQKERTRTYPMFQRMGDPVDMGVEYKPAPLSHDRYAIWDLELTPGLVDTWGPESRWYNTCPPFIAFDSSWNQIEWNPPLPATSGPEFNGDMAGDGPPAPNTECLVRVTIRYGMRIPNQAGEHLYVQHIEPIPISDYFLEHTLLNPGRHDQWVIDMAFDRARVDGMRTDDPVAAAYDDELEFAPLDLSSYRLIDNTGLMTYARLNAPIVRDWTVGPYGPVIKLSTPVQVEEPAHWSDYEVHQDSVSLFRMEYRNLPHIAQSYLSHETGQETDTIIVLTYHYTREESYDLIG